MIEVFTLALALSMDAFAVSVGLGVRHGRFHCLVALKAALYFGLFQALMPVLGYFGGLGVAGWVGGYTPWVAFGLLLAIGGKMIVEALRENEAPKVASISHQVLLVLALATSIDALAAGFTLLLLPVEPMWACVLIGLVTAAISAFGVFVGTKGSVWLQGKAELFGGIVLVLIGFKLLLY